MPSPTADAALAAAAAAAEPPAAVPQQAAAAAAEDHPPSHGLAARWRERWCRWRDALLTRADFQRRAARSPLLRPVVRRRAGELFDLVAGFVYSQVLLACVRLDVFETLAAAPRTTATLARRWGIDPEAVERLMAAAAALDLVERRDGARWGLGRLGAPLVGNGAITAMIEHHAVLYADLGDPVALLRGDGPPTALSRYWAYAAAPSPAALPASSVGDYSALMSASQPLVADEVLDAWPLASHRCLLDVGGGQGRFVVAAARRAPHLSLMLFDLPGVVPAAREAFAAAGLGDRARAWGGDFTTDPLPAGADIVTLVRVIYDHPDERALAILRAAWRALPSGGTLLIAEPMADAAGAPRMGDAYFGIYLLAMRGGRPRTSAQLAALLTRAGFDRVRQRPTTIPLQVGVVVARRP